MGELFGLLNLLDRAEYPYKADFLDRFGGAGGVPPRADQVQAVRGCLKHLLLRRMKEDVETLPAKEEMILKVELTTEQYAYYKAVYEHRIGTLLAGASKKNVPQLRNVAMELRKVCNHPYMCAGLRDDLEAKWRAKGSAAEGGVATATGLAGPLVLASGKMVLLDKLLPRLRAEGRRVLIFSQFKGMLNLLEEYLAMRQYPFERLDGDTAEGMRQAAIDRFSEVDAPGAGGSGGGPFVFLLSTKAGGVGITLTAASVCIIYDSDWCEEEREWCGM